MAQTQVTELDRLENERLRCYTKYLDALHSAYWPSIEWAYNRKTDPEIAACGKKAAKMYYSIAKCNWKKVLDLENRIRTKKAEAGVAA